MLILLILLNINFHLQLILILYQINWLVESLFFKKIKYFLMTKKQRNKFKLGSPSHTIEKALAYFI